MLTITPDVEDFDDIANEYVNVYLQRGRAMTRLNRGWDRRTGTGQLRNDAYREFDLADLYLERLSRREKRLIVKLDEGIRRMRDGRNGCGPTCG